MTGDAQVVVLAPVELFVPLPEAVGDVEHLDPAGAQLLGEATPQAQARAELVEGQPVSGEQAVDLFPGELRLHVRLARQEHDLERDVAQLAGPGHGEIGLERARQQARALQFGGAAGTLASLGDDAPAVATHFARALKLDLPALPWHAHRDRLVEVAAALGMLTGTLGKMARDVSLLMQTEIAEAAEPAGEGRGGSSTMPHKRNPVGCAAVLSAAVRVPPLVGTMFAAMPQEHERALGGWQAEWDTLPQIITLAAGALRQMGDVIGSLHVDAARMRANLDITHGLILGEAAMLELGRRIGRMPAHRLVEAASHRAIAHGLTLRDALAQQLREDPSHAGLLDDAALDRLSDPARYAGQATSFADAAVAAWGTARAERKND